MCLFFPAKSYQSIKNQVDMLVNQRLIDLMKGDDSGGITCSHGGGETGRLERFPRFKQ